MKNEMINNNQVEAHNSNSLTMIMFQTLAPMVFIVIMLMILKFM